MRPWPSWPTANRGEIPKIASRCAVFAKTDLSHAQQEGFSLAEICDGLCFGLARNIVDTLFTGGGAAAPLIMSGGVSLNRAVVGHLSSLIGMPIVVDAYSPCTGPSARPSACSRKKNPEIPCRSGNRPIFSALRWKKGPTTIRR